MTLQGCICTPQTQNKTSIGTYGITEHNFSKGGGGKLIDKDTHDHARHRSYRGNSGVSCYVTTEIFIIQSFLAVSKSTIHKKKRNVLTKSTCTPI